jgi:UDP-N-acetylmuramate: L-alanyl-gamma-D-glutamyl-meso-diaminopimelate ligase
MRIFILGVCGTFMGGLARLASELGHQVGGCDANVYPPMSDQLRDAGIQLFEGYDPDRMVGWRPDLIIIGNALSRGNPCVERVLNGRTRFVSGPQWVYEEVLRERWVLAVAGTHGKTTTAGLACWLLEHAGFEPGFLIGGVLENFGLSARLGSGRCFVIEADEYDSAFFDKRSKFVHYHPRTLVLNNLEFDHADIFGDLDEIKRQFHHLVRIVPEKGMVVANRDDQNIQHVLEIGCWSGLQRFSISQDSDWIAREHAADFSRFEVTGPDGATANVESPLIGSFNMANTLAAVAAVHHAGVALEAACGGVSGFSSVKRRLELRATVRGIGIYDDFAHHPTAIESTLAALRQRSGGGRIICVLEPRSNTMLLGGHRHSLAGSLGAADHAVVLNPPNARWDLHTLAGANLTVHDTVQDIVRSVAARAESGDRVVVMSNGSFDNIHDKLIEALSVTH